MSLRLHNTLTLQVQPFAPDRDNTVRMYTCGPTVYDYAHIGNFRTFVFYDILRRWLQASGFGLNHVMNITDVDDKIIRNATAQGKSIGDYSAIYTKAYFEDSALLRLQTPEHITPATEHIPEMAEAIRKLGEQGYTYEGEGSTYFRISKFPEYGKLSHINFSGNRAGARVDVDEYEKDDARDFVLWKAAKENEPYWDTVVGRGRPGWHIECSVMAIEYLGDTLDLHAGGVDLIFPHHENEIAQSESLTHHPFARFWVHSEFLLVDGQKMSKSLGNFHTLRDILDKGHSPESVRYLLASVPYRKALNFTFDGLKSAATAIDRMRNFALRLATEHFEEGQDVPLDERAVQAIAAFRESMDDDLNTAEALAATFEYVRDVNIAMDRGEFRTGSRERAQEVLNLFDSVFDVLSTGADSNALADDKIDALIEERKQSKKSRNFARADEIRALLADAGVILEDTKDGVRWKRK
jgi:cysteinyl-tRNA synthetase